MARTDAAIRRCWQEWLDSSRFQRHYGSGRPNTAADREDGLIVRSAVTAPESSLSTIRRATCTTYTYDHSQTSGRAKFTLVPTATPSATHVR
ncbi:uncharacterized protein TNCV_4314741 [Trichonephila clavipes]|nr:uncharacterized protein TNCV_4314741 [Trichonephila clavipes]